MALLFYIKLLVKRKAKR